MQISSSLLKNVDVKLERYDAASSKIKQADLERDGDKVVTDTNSEFRDVFIRSDVPENERVTIYEGKRPDYFTAEYAGRMVKSMSNSELYEILTGRKVEYGLTVKPGEKDKYGNVNTTDHDIFDSSAMGKSVTDIIKTGGAADFVKLGDSYVRIGTLTNQQLAEYFADMGKRIDQAYAEGKFTEEEYNFLNSSLNEYIENATVTYQRAKANSEIGFKRMNSFEERMNFINERSGMTTQEMYDAFQKEIDDYVEKYTKVDRDWLYDMINRLRYGVGTLLK